VIGDRFIAQTRAALASERTCVRDNEDYGAR
jgi:hypothetical protein